MNVFLCTASNLQTNNCLIYFKRCRKEDRIEYEGKEADYVKVIKYNCEISRSDLNKGLFNNAKCNKVVAREAIDEKKQLDSLIRLIADFYIDDNSHLRLN